MLPFLKTKKESSIGITEQKKLKDGEIVMDEMSELDIVAEELIAAMEMKDVAGVSQALKAAFEIMDAMPHEEGPHI